MQREREEGAVAVIVAICLLVLFGAGAIAIDLGSAWETKRGLVVDTDAAALAGAHVLFETKSCSDAESQAENYLRNSTGDSSIDLVQGVNFDCSLGASTVTVEHIDRAQQTFSGALGTDELPVFGSSTAKSEPGEALRPIALCNNDDVVEQFTVDPDAGPVSSWVSLDRFEKSSDDEDCSTSPGNWGWLCFDKTNCGADKLRDRLIDGYDGDVTLGEDPVDADDNACENVDDSPYCTTEPGNLGAGKTGQDALDSITCGGSSGCPIFPLLVIEDYEDSGRDKVTPWGFLYVKVDGWCAQGKAGGAANGVDCDKGSGRDKGTHLDVTALQLQKTGVPGELYPSVRISCVDGADPSQCS